MGMEMATEETTIDKIIEEIIIDKTMVTKRYRNRSPSQDCSRSRQRYRNNSRDNFRNRSYNRSQSRNRDPFLEEILGMAITKLLDTKSHLALTLKLKLIRNRATLKVTNSTQERVTFNPDHAVGIVDLRSLGYYKIKQGVLEQNLSHCYHLELAESVCDQYNRLINTLRKEEQEASVCGKDKYPWLDDSDERKHMTDKEVLDKYINLDNSCLTR